MLDKIIIAAAFLFAELNYILWSVHMLQLSSYQSPMYFRSIHSMRNLFVPPALVFIFTLPFLCFAGISRIYVYALAILFIVAGLFRRPIKDAKIKLVFTPRVKRMLVTCGIICIGAAVLFGVVCSTVWFALIVMVLYALSPYITLLACMINSPIEIGINQYYINDAIDKLESASRLKVIGITGSYGKTSVKYYLSEILNSDYNVLKTPGNYNTTLGVVRTVRSSLRGYHDVFVCEMGARHVGDIEEICEVVSPDIGIITAIGEQHLETFGSKKNILKTKLELADAVNEKHGKIFINGDSVTEAKLLPYDSEIITYGTDEDCDYRAVDISFDSDGMTFNVITPSGEKFFFRTELLGTHNAVNITGAVAVAHNLGIKYNDMFMRISRLKPVEHRQQLKKTPDYILIDDAYNSNPAGCKAALETLSGFDGFKILITPGMVELGAMQDKYNTEFGQNAAKVCDCVVLVGRRQTAAIYQGLSDEQYPTSKIIIATDFKDAMRQVNAIHCDKQKVILIENDLPDNY